MEIKVGRTYRAKKPRPAGTFLESFFNDRTVLWVGASEIQYDGPSVANGRKYPRVSREAFEKWAGEDVTDKLPKGKYQYWN